MRSLVMGWFVLAAPLGAAGGSPRAEYEALVREYDTASRSAVEAITRAADDRQRMEAVLRRPRPDQFAPRFLALAEGHADDPVALDALIWVASKCIFGPEAEKALGLIARDHARSDRLGDFCGQCSRYGEPFPPYEEMLRAVLRETPHRQIRGSACLALAEYLKMAKETTESSLVKLATQGERALGEARLAKVRRIEERGLDAVGAEAEALFREVIDRYPDLRIATNYPASAAELAKSELRVLRELGVGRTAPEIVGKDIRGKPMTLGDYRGKVVVLDFGSHRSCGVCRQMYPYLRSMAEKYRDRPFALLGISVEDDVKELVKLADDGENTWPIWWDGENMEGPIAARWAIRAMPTFYILDAKGVIRNKGFIQPPDIEATVDMLLKEMGPAAP